MRAALAPVSAGIAEPAASLRNGMARRMAVERHASAPRISDFLSQCGLVSRPGDLPPRIGAMYVPCGNRFFEVTP